LARLLWLAAPVKLLGLDPLKQELRKRGQHTKLDAKDLCHIVAAMRCQRRVVLVEELRLLKTSEKLPDDLPSVRSFRLSFDLVPHGRAGEDPCSILRLVDEGHEALRARDCLPTFCMVPETTRLFAFLGPVEKTVAKYNSPDPGLPVGEPSRIVVMLSGKTFTVAINGHEVFSTAVSEDVTSQVFSVPTKVWAGDVVYKAANASIGNLVYFCKNQLHDDDDKLLHKVALRLRAESVCAEICTEDLAPLAEGLEELGVRDEQALRTLGQEILQRKPEISSEDLRRIHIAYNMCKLPLNTVWAALGVTKKRKGGDVVTTQVFVPQHGHDKKHRSEREVERASPPRMCSDPVQSSY
jgi:hypothetical protein